MVHEALAGTIKTFSYEQTQPMFKTTDLRKYLGIGKISDHFKDFPSNYTCVISEIPGAGLIGICFDMLRSGKNIHVIFINLDGFTKMVVQPNKSQSSCIAKITL